MTGKQRRALRALAHSLKPLLQLGKHGLSDQFLEQLDTALLQHELIKLKVLENAPNTPQESGKILETQPELDGSFEEATYSSQIGRSFSEQFHSARYMRLTRDIVHLLRV